MLIQNSVLRKGNKKISKLDAGKYKFKNNMVNTSKYIMTLK